MIVDKFQHVLAGFTAAVFLAGAFRLTAQRVPIWVIFLCVMVIAITTEVADGIRRFFGGVTVFDIGDILGAMVGASIFLIFLFWARATVWTEGN